MKRIHLSIAILFWCAVVSSAAAQDQNERPVIVGRISYISGELLRYVPAENDWVATVKDAPFGLNDALYSGDDSKAEFIIPNGTRIRIGDFSQLQLIAIEDDYTEADIASGVGRFYNNSADGVVKTTTPFGYIVAPAKTSFDVYVGDDSVEVISLEGDIDFILANGEEKYPVSAGGPSIIADSRQVTSGEGIADEDWDAFNAERDHFWDSRLQARSDSMNYLPENLDDEAYALDEYGQWDQVYYEGEYRKFWRPTRVVSGWAPFTYGHWTVWYDDNCWIPDEEFGYVTHHYGNWIYVNNYWYWMPPLVTVRAAVRPSPFIGFGWYPGRVSWIYTDAYVGWVPLAPNEPYYCHRHWGPRSYVIGPAHKVRASAGKYAYINHAVIIRQTNLYGTANYNSVRVKNITTVNNFKVAPVVNNTVINNYNTTTNKYNFTNVHVTKKPHESVTQRIRHNEETAKQTVNVSGKTVYQESTQIRQAKPSEGVHIETPAVVSDKFVPPDAVKKPESEISFPQKKIIKKEETVNIPMQPGQPIPAGRHESPQAPAPEHREVWPQQPRSYEEVGPGVSHPEIQQPPAPSQHPQSPRPQFREIPEAQPSIQELPKQPRVPAQMSPEEQQPSPRKTRRQPQAPLQEPREVQPQEEEQPSEGIRPRTTYPEIQQHPVPQHHQQMQQSPIRQRPQEEQPSIQETPQETPSPAQNSPRRQQPSPRQYREAPQAPQAPVQEHHEVQPREQEHPQGQEQIHQQNQEPQPANKGKKSKSQQEEEENK